MPGGGQAEAAPAAADAGAVRERAAAKLNLDLLVPARRVDAVGLDRDARHDRPLGVPDDAGDRSLRIRCGRGEDYSDEQVQRESKRLLHLPSSAGFPCRTDLDQRTTARPQDIRTTHDLTDHGHREVWRPTTPRRLLC